MDVGWNDLGACQEGGVALPLAVGSANSALGQVGRSIHAVCSLTRLQEGLCRALFKHGAPMQLLPEAALGEQGLAFQARGASAAGRLGMLALQHEAGC